MPSRTLLVLSAGLNAGLLGVLFYLIAFRIGLQEPLARPIAANDLTAVRGAARPQRRGPGMPAVRPFRWNMIASSDYPLYIANLRAIGCPEQTVQDIIIAETQRAFAARGRLPISEKVLPANRSSSALRQEKQKQVEALDSEQRIRLKEWFGIDWYGPVQNDRYELAIIEFVLGISADKKTEQTAALVERYEALSRAFDDRVDHIFLPEDKRQRRELGEHLRAELTSLLGAARVEEFELRTLTIEQIDNDNWAGLNLTGAELREIARLKREAAPPFKALLRTDDELSAAEQERFEVELRRLLGDARFADYRRAQEPMVREMSESANP
jgi:hypothetical protein